MSGPDSSLFYCLEHLAMLPNVPYSSIYEFVGNIDLPKDNPLPNPLHCRLILCGLLHSDRVSAETLRSLVGINNIVVNNFMDFDQSVSPRLIPPPELLLQVKTELVAQVWAVSNEPKDIIQVINQLFAQPVPPLEISRYDELLKAATDPTFRIKINRALDARAALLGVIRFAESALDAMGPTLLQVVNNDINHGRYFPGRNLLKELEPAEFLDEDFVRDGSNNPARPLNNSSTQLTALAANKRKHPAADADNDNAAALFKTTPINGTAINQDQFIDLNGNSNAGSALHRRQRRKTADEEQTIPDAYAAVRAAGIDDRVIQELQAAAAVTMRNIGRGPVLDTSQPHLAAALDPIQRLALTPLQELGQIAGMLSPSDIVRLAGMREPNATVKKPDGRRHSKKWSELEVRCLMEGCREFNPGRWSLIFRRYQNFWETYGRNQVDLKDKWRNLLYAKNPEALELEAMHEAKKTKKTESAAVEEQEPNESEYQSAGDEET